MLTTVKKIQISQTTTSCRIKLDNVNFEATLDERYKMRSQAEKKSSLGTVEEMAREEISESASAILPAE